jgi:hypothetical protein
MQSGNTGLISIHEVEGAEPTPDSRIAREALCGGFLHGDTDKRDRNQHRNNMSINLALFGWLSYVESVCGVLYQMCWATVEKAR